ncbi:MAG: hypothetical protein WCV85_06475 [Patescibacteria group bacterium]|jgi:(p)ppGpp synthase/HD superfamily hydrolase
MAPTTGKPRRIRIGYSQRIFDRPTFERIAQTQLYSQEFELVMLAYRLAKYGHKNQFRHDLKTRYFDHCKSVALIIMLECKVFLFRPLCVGLTHDLGEDSRILNWWGVEHVFGKDVYRGLRILTKEEGKNYYWGLQSVEPKDWWIILVKLADRLHNMRTILKEPKAFQLKQLKETEEIFPVLIENFATIVPKRFQYLSGYFTDELTYACNRVRKQQGMPKTTVFHRTA